MTMMNMLKKYEGNWGIVEIAPISGKERIIKRGIPWEKDARDQLKHYKTTAAGYRYEAKDLSKFAA